MHRSRSHTALNSVAVESEDDVEDDQQTIALRRHGTTDDLQECEYQIIVWYGSKKKIPLVNFSPACLLLGAPENAAETVKKYHMTFRFVKTECRLVRSLLQSHGFRESHPYSSYFNLYWSGGQVKPFMFRTLTEYQKVNHFPRSYEITRKDRLCKNIQKMQYNKGQRHFDFIPSSFILPSELADFQNAFIREKGLWIVKPVASSRGRGIYLISDPSQICLDDHCMVCRYIDNPLLVDGYKFDLRIYIVVTSFDPLRIYMFEEGLSRFSTVKYDKRTGQIGNRWMHLTNYSVNKTNADYVRCEDPEVDDYGNKWSLSAMLRYLKEEGVDTEVLMGRVEEVVVKAMLSVEMSIANAFRMFVPSRWNCFELFGFDILVDENLKPWLLEVNLSPSLACDAPMDLKIKSTLMSDVFNITGIVAHDPVVNTARRGKIIDPKKLRALSANPGDTNLVTKVISQAKANLGLTNEESKLLRETKEEYKRRGGLVRIFPTPESWDIYGNLHEQPSRNNKMIHSRLFPDLWRSAPQRPSSASTLAPIRTTDNLVFCKARPVKSTVYGLCLHDRYAIYERKLENTSSFETPKIIKTEVQEDNSFIQPDTETKVPYEVALLNAANQNNRRRARRRRSLSVQEIIDRGETMTTIQARQAFAIYLQRVQHRLLQEISASRQNGRIDGVPNHKEEGQLDLIIRFLVRASANLSKPLDVSIPTVDSFTNERRSLLAKKLGEFVKLYSKDTKILMTSDPPDDGSDLGSQNDYDMGNISDRDFETFLAVGSENELEDLLTAFTKQNNSSVIFLGTKSDTGNDLPLKPSRSHNSTTNHRSHRSTSSYERVQDREPTGRSWKEVLESSKDNNISLHSDKYTRRLTTAKVYSSSVAINQTKRPTSAKVGLEKARSAGTRRSRSTSVSASAVKTPNGVFPEANRDALNADDHDAIVVGDALQRLLIKQSERNYSAARTTYYVSPKKTYYVSPEMNKYTRRSTTNDKVDRSVDANDTFKSLVDLEHVLSKDSNEQVTKSNSLEHTTGTQTIESCVEKMLNGSDTCHADDMEHRFEIPDTKREAKLVSKAQYNAHMRSLERGPMFNESNDIQPHPPSSKPPPIRKTIRTQRMAKLSGHSGKE